MNLSRNRLSLCYRLSLQVRREDRWLTKRYWLQWKGSRAKVRRTEGEERRWLVQEGKVAFLVVLSRANGNILWAFENSSVFKHQFMRLFLETERDNTTSNSTWNKMQLVSIERYQENPFFLWCMHRLTHTNPQNSDWLECLRRQQFIQENSTSLTLFDR